MSQEFRPAMVKFYFLKMGTRGRDASRDGTQNKSWVPGRRDGDANFKIGPGMGTEILKRDASRPTLMWMEL